MHSKDAALGADIISPFAGMSAAFDSIGDFSADHLDALRWQIAAKWPMPFKLYDCLRWHHEVHQEGMIPVDCLEVLVPVPNPRQPPLWSNDDTQHANYIEAGGIAYLHRVDPHHSDSEANTALYHSVLNVRHIANYFPPEGLAAHVPGYTCLATRVSMVDKPVNGFLDAIAYLSNCHPEPSMRDAVNHAIDNFALANGVAA